MFVTTFSIEIEKDFILFCISLQTFRYFSGHIKSQTTNTLCRASIFTCIMAMISNVLIIYIFRELFQDSLPTNVTISSP